MTLLRRLFLLLVMALAVPVTASPLWTLTWYDEGSGAANTPPDNAKWRFDTGGGGWGNSELETYTNRTQNARYDGAGNLILEARAENYTGTDGINRNYTSARITTGATFSQAYGRMEARIQIPYGQGIWPAFWMLGANIGPAGWPGCGEIDIMENVGYEPNITHGTIHGPGYSGGNGIGYGYNTGSALSSAYHLYAVEWEPNIIRWYIDNTLYETRTPADLPGGTTWVYDHNFFMILNLAVGGAWPGNPDGSTVFPQQMKVDYVRVYQRDTTRRPYNSALPIPGTIQAADYDDGGEGVSYHDTTVLNQGGAARTSDPVDLEACSGDGGGYDLGYTAAGEYLKYTVDVAAAGAYELRVRIASLDAGGTFHFTLDGAPLAGSNFTTPNTTGWQTWATLGPQTVTLPAGQHDLALVFDSNGPGGGCGNLHWFSFTQLTTPTYTPSPSATRTATPLPSATFSVSPTPSATRSATASVTSTRSPTATRTTSPTATATPTDGPSSTATPTATAADSPTLTNTPLPGSPTFSHSPTASPTTSPTVTATPSSSQTATATLSSTVTPTATLSATASVSPSATSSLTESPTSTLTDSPTLSASPSPSASATATPVPASPTPSATPSPVDTATSVPTGVVGQHDRVWLACNPQTGKDLQVVIESVAGLKDARVRVYSAAMNLVAEEPLGAFGPGWHGRRIPAEYLHNGTYWLKLSEGPKPLGPPARLYVLR